MAIVIITVAQVRKECGRMGADLRFAGATDDPTIQAIIDHYTNLLEDEAIAALNQGGTELASDLFVEKTINVSAHAANTNLKSGDVAETDFPFALHVTGGGNHLDYKRNLDVEVETSFATVHGFVMRGRKILVSPDTLTAVQAWVAPTADLVDRIIPDKVKEARNKIIDDVYRMMQRDIKERQRKTEGDTEDKPQE